MNNTACGKVVSASWLSGVHIFQNVLRMPATKCRAKALLSTYLPHLTVVTIFHSMTFISYLKPVSDTSSVLDLLVSVTYTLSSATQLFLVVLFAASEFFILMAMSFDCYAAICLPVTYEFLMKPRASGKMVDASWLRGGLLGILFSALIFSLPFCGSNVVQHFLCDVLPPMKIICSDHSAIDVIMTFGITISIFGYLKPPSHSSSMFDLLMSVFYVRHHAPALKFLIYSLRNQDMNAAL
ncbi:olfactory receptor 14A2-like [Tachyglossus aculeatus]|uniref:olfactory receptor 14A2-like n=1 Tax=Tachyglossus aculeatus TaxID=9261 RepID=UPI0018F3738F|nr:olfactory receptor 14A2-like [Tachyglossus aculeatus]